MKVAIFSIEANLGYNKYHYVYNNYKQLFGNSWILIFIEKLY